MTLLVFLFFITAFVLYRAGTFDKYLSSESSVQTSPNGGNVSTGGIDTLPKTTKDSSHSQRLMLSSSKSLVLIDRKLSLSDSISLKRTIDSANDLRKRIMLSSSKSGHVISADDPFFMPSSKSGPVFVPRKKIEPPVIKYNRDSLRLRLAADSATHIKR